MNNLPFLLLFALAGAESGRLSKVPPFAFPVKIGELFSSWYSLPPPPSIHPQEKGHFEKKRYLNYKWEMADYFYFLRNGKLFLKGTVGYLEEINISDRLASHSSLRDVIDLKNKQTNKQPNSVFFFFLSFL